ncbi:MAG: Abi family protein [Bacteroidales bacterium]|nr:Abi family protein [Bacteroidales bacterium]
MNRYLNACGGNSRKAMTLYRYNLRLSQDMFTIISCYEVALRNAIDRIMVQRFGPDWLRDSILPGGVFSNPKFGDTAKIIRKAYLGLIRKNAYSHSKLLAEMEFGVWKHLFSTPHFSATGRVLLQVFPRKPKSSARFQYNNSFLYNELDSVNRLRNRIAHHEPICFLQNCDKISTFYLKGVYWKLYSLFQWMEIDASDILYGLDHVDSLTSKIDSL